MYTIGEEDNLIQLTQIPEPDTEWPQTTIFTDGNRLFLAYYLKQNASVPEEPIVLLSDRNAVAPSALISFIYTRIHMFGLPNGEALDEHPLSSRGLKVHGAFEVENSSWTRSLEETNIGYREHEPEHFEVLRHFIFTFRDNTFECLAEDYGVSLHKESITTLMRVAIDKR